MKKKFTILPKQIVEFGIDEDYIRYLHSKTKLSQLTIESVEYIRHTSDIILIRLKLIAYFNEDKKIISEEEANIERINRNINSTLTRQMWMRRQMSLEVSKSKMREKKLNQLLH